MQTLSPAPSSILRSVWIDAGVPLAVLVIAATAIPIEIRPARHTILDLGANQADMVQNVLGYIPLGLAFARLGVAKALGITALLSLCAEIAQIWSIGRFPAPIDFLSNVAGASIGIIAGRRWPLPPIRIGRRIAITAAAAAIVVITVLAIPGEPSTLENWDPSAQLILGDEVSRDRRWDGEILSLEIVPGYGPVTDPYPMREPLLVREERQRFFETMVRRGAFTIKARIRPNNVEQEGPARIVTYSLTPLSRNFTLGQERQQLVFRVRTPASDLNGLTAAVQTFPVLLPDREVSVVASYDGHISRVFVDGRLAGRENLAAAGRLTPVLADVHLPMMAVITGLLFALAAAGWLGTVTYISAMWTTSAAGIAGAIALLVTGGASAVPAYYPWIPVLGLSGGAAVGLSIKRSL
jgi:hypothetical protein